MTQLDLARYLVAEHAAKALEAPAQRHSETSRAAAKAITPRASTLRDLVLAFIRSRRDGVIDEEIANELHLSQSTARPRRIEIVQLGLVEDSGHTRRTKANRSATVWRAREGA